MFGIGMQELLIVFGVMVLIFGPKRLPQIGRSLGESIREFRGVRNEITRGIDE